MKNSFAYYLLATSRNKVSITPNALFFLVLDGAHLVESSECIVSNPTVVGWG